MQQYTILAGVCMPGGKKKPNTHKNRERNEFCLCLSGLGFKSGKWNKFTALGWVQEPQSQEGGKGRETAKKRPW